MNYDSEAIIKTIFAKIKKIPENKIDMEADLFEVYGLDSLRAVKLLSTLEVELDIEFPDEETAKIRTLNDVLACIRRLQAGAMASATVTVNE